MKNLNGKWSYSEDFGMGISKGEVELYLVDDTLTAEFVFIEAVEGDYKIRVEETAVGKVVDGKAVLENMSVIARDMSGKLIEYSPNNFEMNIMSETKIVGSSYDKELVCGVFTLEKIIR